MHALKFQSVALPINIIANMYELVGRYYILATINQYLKNHDASMLGHSGLLQQLQRYARNPGGHFMCINPQKCSSHSTDAGI